MKSDKTKKKRTRNPTKKSDRNKTKKIGEKHLA